MNPRQRRAVLLLALAGLGLIGVFALVANYVADVNTRVGPKVTVLMLTREAKANEAVTDDMVVDEQVPRRWAPKAALRDRTQLVGLVAGSDLARDSILQEGMLQAPPQIPPGGRELAILVDAATGVAGKIQPGSVVDVLAAYPADQNGRQPNRSVVVVPGARVIDVGQPRARASANGVQGAQPQDPTQVVPVTFALNAKQQLLVQYAEAFASEVRLSLLRPGDRSALTPDQKIYRGEDPVR